MNENTAGERIRQAAAGSLSWLDDLPSQEEIILKKINTRMTPLIAVLNGEGEIAEKASESHDRHSRFRRFRPLIALCSALLLAAGGWMVYHNAKENSQVSMPDVVTQPDTQEKETLPAAASDPSAKIRKQLSLDRIDLYIDPDLLWDHETGILAEGDQIEKVPGMLPFKNAVYRQAYDNGTSAEGEMIYKDDQGIELFRDRISLKLGGDAYSVDMPQKSFRIDALDGSFDHPLFNDRNADAYPSILLRNAGNDCLFTRVADGVQNRLIEKHTDLKLLTLAWRPVRVYLNDEYWGIYNMRESMDAHTICRYEQIPDDQAESIMILSISGNAIQGDASEYRKLRAKVRMSDPAGNPKDMEYLEQEIDIDSFLDWLAVEIYFGNTDPSTGVVYQLPGGKCKCLVQDLDYGLYDSHYDAVSGYLEESGMGLQGIDNSIFRKILEVEKYKELFIEKVGTLYKTLTTEVMQQELDTCVSWIEPGMKEHLERWAPYNDGTIIQGAPSDPEKAWDYWKGRIERMRDGTMKNRPQYVYQYIQEFFSLDDQVMEAYFQ